ncbi:LuxR family transcriptional regulator, partial [Vibrio anguillarum]
MNTRMFGILMSLILSTSTVAAETEPSINALVGIKQAPKLGERFRVDTAGYNAAPVTLVCMEASPYTAFSYCELNSNARGLYLEIGETNFTGKNVSGELIEFIGIQHGQLFFKL